MSDREPLPPLENEGMYVIACRRLARRAGGVVVDDQIIPIEKGEGNISSRLVAAGFKRVPPSEWIRGNLLGNFVMWWNKSQENPYEVTSKANAPVPVAFHFWNYLRQGAPRAKELSIAIHAVPGWAWERLLSKREGAEIAWASVLQGAEIGRAIRRFRVNERSIADRMSNDALAVLGSKSPETQRVVIAELMKTPAEEWPTRIRPRHLPIDLIAKTEAGVQKSPRYQTAIAYGEEGTGRRFEELIKKHAPNVAYGDYGAFFSPAYPHLPTEIAVRIARGETPAQISGGVLNKAEAHAWLQAYDRYPSVTGWITRDLARLEGYHEPRSVAIARWMVDVHKRGAWGQLTKERVLYGPMQEQMTYRYADKIDEIQDEDLDEGVKTGVQAAFENAAHRMSLPMIDRMSGDHRVLHRSGWPLLKNAMRELNTPALLVREGEDMTHCVGTYVSAIQRGNIVILALNVNGRRSTAELEHVRAGGRAPKIYQHFGCHNGPPPKACVALLDFWMKKVFEPSKG